MKCQKACSFQFSKHFNSPDYRKQIFKCFLNYLEKNKQTSLTFCEILVYPTLLKSEMFFVHYTSISSLPMWQTTKRVSANISAKAFPVNNVLKQQRAQMPHLQQLSKLIVAAWLFAKASALETPRQECSPSGVQDLKSLRTFKRTSPPSL